MLALGLGKTADEVRDAPPAAVCLGEFIIGLRAKVRPCVHGGGRLRSNLFQSQNLTYAPRESGSVH